MQTKTVLAHLVRQLVYNMRVQTLQNESFGSVFGWSTSWLLSVKGVSSYLQASGLIKWSTRFNLVWSQPGKWSFGNPTHGVFRYWWTEANISWPNWARLVSSLWECLRACAEERSDVHRAGLCGEMFDDRLWIEREQCIPGWDKNSWPR